MAANVNTDALAMQASELTGLPTDFVKALITEEGTLSSTNNPFDITNYWASLTGFGNSVLGLWNQLGSIPGFGTVGVAVFDDARKAVQAWAQGLMQFSAYAQFRNDMSNPNATARQLAMDLQNAGYAGSDTSYADKIAKLYEQISGKSADAPLQGVASPNPSPIPASANPSPSGSGSASGDNGSVDMTFGEGLVHLLIAAGLLLVGILAVWLGVYIILQTRANESGESVTKAIELAAMEE